VYAVLTVKISSKRAKAVWNIAIFLEAEVIGTRRARNTTSSIREL
jgi:hypothetical protein